MHQIRFYYDSPHLTLCMLSVAERATNGDASVTYAAYSQLCATLMIGGVRVMLNASQSDVSTFLADFSAPHGDTPSVVPVLEVKDMVTDHSIIEPDDDDFVFEADASDDEGTVMVKTNTEEDDEAFEQRNLFSRRAPTKPTAVTASTTMSTWLQLQHKINAIIALWSPELLCAPGVWMKIDAGHTLISLLSCAQAHAHLWSGTVDGVDTDDDTTNESLSWTNLCHKVFYLFRYC